MDEVAKYAKTLDEIEGELMFGEIPDDVSEDRNLFDDEYDVANEETFGAVLDDVVDAELEDYAAQTARLRLDDPVWENTKTTAAPDASQIPMPFSMFDGKESFNFGQNDSFAAQSPFLDRSLWGNAEDNSSSGFNIWGTDFSLNKINPPVPADPSLGDLSSLLGDDNTLYDNKRKSPLIPAMPKTAVTLEDLERNATKVNDIQVNVANQQNDQLGLDFEKLAIGSNRPVQHQSVQAPGHFPPEAISIEELEKRLLEETKALSISPKINTQQPINEAPSQISVFPPMSPSVAQMQQRFNQPIPHMPMPAIPMQMPLPALPPLNPQFLPLVPVWLTHIMNQIPIPLNMPPPPPFLLQLLNVYKNPQLVYQMIMQSSIPQNMRMPVPMMHQQQPPQSPSHRYQRKQPGMPSIRTIQDLAWDSFAGYMSWKEREWLVRIQILQCKGCGDPQVEDYYYTTWRDKQIANGWKPKPASVAESEKNETKQDYIERTRRMNYREAQKERAIYRQKEREKERAERAEKGEERRPKMTLSDKFATSLGLPSKSSTHNPRHLIDMKQRADNGGSSTDKKMTDEERKIAVAKKLRTMLLRLEGAMTMLIEIDELRRPTLGDHSRFKDLTSEQKDKEVEERTTLIIDELMGEDLHKLLQMTKGRSVINKTLKVVGPKDQARIILALFSAGGLVNKKMYGEIALDILPVVYAKISALHPDQFAFLVKALNLDVLKKQLFENNMFIRDVLLTIFMVADINGQPLIEWAAGTRFPSLVIDNTPLNYWRTALNSVSNEDIRDFAETIRYSKLRECEELATLIEASIN